MTSKKDITLHPYQQQMLEGVVKDFSKNVGRLEHIVDENDVIHNRQMGRALMVQMPTGTGKTVLMAACIKELRRKSFQTTLSKTYAKDRKRQLKMVDESTPSKKEIKIQKKGLQTEEERKTLIKEAMQRRWDKEDEAVANGGPMSIWVVAHRIELVEQIRETLTTMGVTHVDGEGKMDRRTGLPVKVMSVQWLSRHYDEMSDQPALFVIDEAHHSLAQSYKVLWELYPMAMKLGFTATPCRMKLESFYKLYDKLHEGEQVKWYIEHGYLSEYDYVVCHKQSFSQRKVYNLKKYAADGDFAIMEMEKEFNVTEAISDLYEKLIKFAPNKKGIVYAIDIHHAKCVAKYYQQKGIRAVALDNKTPAAKRKADIEKFKAGELDCIVNVDLFSEGFDCPDVDYVQLARPTLSLAKYLQMVGRGLRTHPNKELCMIIDNVGLWYTFGPPDSPRNWPNRFIGLYSGKFEIAKPNNTSYALNNDMVTMRSHVKLSKEDEERVAEEEKIRKKRLLREVAPFQHNGKWGLQNTERIVVPAMHKYISQARNGYFLYENSDEQWGVLNCEGETLVEASYRNTKARFLEAFERGYVEIEITRFCERDQYYSFPIFYLQ